MKIRRYESPRFGFYFHLPLTSYLCSNISLSTLFWSNLSLRKSSDCHGGCFWTSSHLGHYTM